jgi:hypothetical protein
MNEKALRLHFSKMEYLHGFIAIVDLLADHKLYEKQLSQSYN